MFTVYGPGITDPIHLEKLFAQGKVTKTVAISPELAIDAKQHTTQSEQQHRERTSGAANQHYQTLAYGEKESPLLRAGQIMTSPVISIQAGSSVADAISMLENGAFRHIPVLNHDHQLVGLLSDRDLIRCLCGSGSVCMHCSTDKQVVPVHTIMKAPVLTTTIDTDARHIARLFVEQKIGAIPIMDGKTLAGIISRSDILQAVMHHFALELWV
ncbi:CBS domain-containing protein [Mariprofundus ferrooxydans]|uniref:Acetoin utilization protein AcuB n=1 Tax=Mariprofundus ferrooxydans PV-1 TaxID=314345 RepID=Q0F1M3_9PROT|nr:CBS domain-containing protein [Mariprofundus ferrooxydans]EAU55168.1 acetoin utilization protein AcuB [Mariprofundus ferrooxydans PV-1]